MQATQILKSALLLTLATVARAWAQPSPPTAPGNATRVVRSNCEAFAPQDAKYSSGLSATLVSVRITSQGEMRDPTLFQSSGDNELDKAALACADGYQVGYVSVGGKPAEVRWVLAHNWATPGSGFGPAYPPGVQNRPCTSSHQANRIENPATTVSYHIATDGTVRDAAVEESSGVPSLDQAVARCVVSWRFFPVTQNGQPVEAGQQLQVNWGKVGE